MKGISGYRILSVFVNFFCVLIAIVLVFAVMMAFANPAVLFECFIMLGVVLYGWFANKFFVSQIVKDTPFSKKQKDLLQVNAILAFLFSFLGSLNSVYILYNPKIMEEAMKQMPAKASQGMITGIAIFLLVLSMALLCHIIWTIILLRKNKQEIQ